MSGRTEFRPSQPCLKVIIFAICVQISKCSELLQIQPAFGPWNYKTNSKKQLNNIEGFIKGCGWFYIQHPRVAELQFLTLTLNPIYWTEIMYREQHSVHISGPVEN